MLPKRDRLNIPSSFGDLLDKLTTILLCSPRFEDPTGGGQPWRNLDVRFYTLNEGLLNLRPKLGEELYHKLAVMSDEIRAYFEADPDETTGETRKGKDLVYEMEEMVKARRAEVQPGRQLAARHARASAKPQSST
jgi:hypothetical protein